MAGGRKHASNIVRVCREGTWTEGWVCKMWTSGCEYGELWSDWRLAVACSCGGCKYGTSRRRWGICGVNGLITFLPLLLLHLFGAFGGAVLLLLTAAGNIFPGSAFPADVAGARAVWGWLVDGRAFFCANDAGMC